MAIDKVKEYFKQFGIDDKIMEFEVSSATVALAAEAVGCEPARIAKTLSFKIEDYAVLIVTAGDSKVDNSKFKAEFNTKAKMLSPDEVIDMVGHEIGGVCPFAVNDGIKVYSDISMKRFNTLFPACGSANSAIEMTCDEIYTYSNSVSWVDVCKGWQNV